MKLADPTVEMKIIIKYIQSL